MRRRQKINWLINLLLRWTLDVAALFFLARLLLRGRQ